MKDRRSRPVILVLLAISLISSAAVLSTADNWLLKVAMVVTMIVTALAGIYIWRSK